MRGGRARLSSGLWAEFSECTIHNVVSGIAFLLLFSLKSITFSERKETAWAIQTQVRNELFPAQLSALQA